MSSKNSCTVRFVTVNTNGEKQAALCRLACNLFAGKQKVLIIVPSKEAGAYVDQLLWKLPEEAFIPHAVCHSETKEPVAITTALSNLNDAGTAINLGASPLPALPGIKTIFELNDRTSPEKEAQSLQKRSGYESAGYQVQEAR